MSHSIPKVRRAPKLTVHASARIGAFDVRARCDIRNDPILANTMTILVWIRAVDRLNGSWIAFFLGVDQSVFVNAEIQSCGYN